jgi:hypothetical protein
MRIFSAIFVMIFAVLFFITPVLAGTKGAIKVSLKDKSGKVVNGTVKGKKGNTSKKCKTKSGTCKLKKLATGKWTVSAKSSDGLVSKSQKVTVKAGKTKKAALTLKKKKETQSAGQSGVVVAPIKAEKKTKETRDLSKGKTKVLLGTTRDDNGRVLNGTVTIKKGSETIGKSKTQGGAYRIYDLSPGTYSVNFESTGGKKSSRTIKIVSGKVADVNLRTK